MRISRARRGDRCQHPNAQVLPAGATASPGATESATRASYDERHVERVRLVRALIDVGHLSIDRVREVVMALEHPPASRHELLGTAHDVLRAPELVAHGEVIEAIAPEVLDQIASLGAPPRRLLRFPGSHGPHSAAAAGALVGTETLRVWAVAMRAVAERDVGADLGSMSPSTRCAMRSSAMS